MFDSPKFPKTLDEELFETWLERGRLSRLNYHYLLVVWNELDAEYQPFYAENRNKIDEYERYPGVVGHESLVAVYDLYSESRIV
nr:hypothetical protein [Cesiribacter sp. SM1]